MVRVSKDRKTDFPEPFFFFFCEKRTFWVFFCLKSKPVFRKCRENRVPPLMFVTRKRVRRVQTSKKNFFSENSTHFHYFKLSTTKNGQKLNFWHLVEDWWISLKKNHEKHEKIPGCTDFCKRSF